MGQNKKKKKKKKSSITYSSDESFLTLEHDKR